MRPRLDWHVDDARRRACVAVPRCSSSSQACIRVLPQLQAATVCWPARAMSRAPFTWRLRALPTVATAPPRPRRVTGSGPELVIGAITVITGVVGTLAGGGRCLAGRACLWALGAREWGACAHGRPVKFHAGAPSRLKGFLGLGVLVRVPGE